MMFRSSVTLLLISTNLLGASAFAPQVAPARTSHSHANSSEESTTALFKKRVAKSKTSGGTGFSSALRDLRNNSFPYAGSIRPGVQSPQKIVIDESIMKPDYALDTIVSTP
jgi:hypothetical protein